MSKFTPGEQFFKNDADGLKRVKAICAKAFSSKKPAFRLNIFRSYSDESWITEGFYTRLVISENAAIVHPQCGKGLSYKLYSPILHVVGIGSIPMNMPKNPDMQETWLALYNGPFAAYQQYLQK